MPQASDELRKKMQNYFGGNGIDDGCVTEYLEARGFTLTKDWLWNLPDNWTEADLTEQDWDCITFLVHEWDFGGLAVWEQK